MDRYEQNTLYTCIRYAKTKFKNIAKNIRDDKWHIQSAN